jgi:hypothetical protein
MESLSTLKQLLKVLINCLRLSLAFSVAIIREKCWLGQNKKFGALKKFFLTAKYTKPTFAIATVGKKAQRAQSHNSVFYLCVLCENLWDLCG